MKFAETVIKQIGFEFERGRLDRSLHPFSTTFSINDVRITTRVRNDYLREALFSCIHEAGHAIYEQGIDQNLEGTTLATRTSTGVHESQSRLWENIIGRSKTFWLYFYPQLQKNFPRELAEVKLETFYKSINKVKPTFTRVGADEITYNLHIMIRFDLEIDLLEGKLSVHDLPEVWNQRYKAELGIKPPDVKYGVLQDIHWFSGAIWGAFQSYTLGNIMGAQFFEAAIQAYSKIVREMCSRNFCILQKFLEQNIHQYVQKYSSS